MGIDIYLGGYDAYKERTTKQRAAFEKACERRDAIENVNSAACKRAQVSVEKAAEGIWSGKVGYLRSSYNSAGLFNVLDRIFGTDSAALLFPGDWDTPADPKSSDGDRMLLPVDWDLFCATIEQMQAVARHLRHGDPLPVKFDELQAKVNPVRQSGEQFGKSVLAMVTQAAEVMGGSVEAGNDHQHGFFNEDDYGWYVKEGLRDLHDFGELGKQLKVGVHISY